MSIRIEPDSFWHQDMDRLPPGDEGTSVIEVRLGGKSAAREIVETIVLTVMIFLAVRGVIQNYRVEGESMLPTLINEQMILVDRFSYVRWDSNFLPRLLGQPDLPAAEHFLFGNGPARGDIIVLHAWHEDKDYIKRVIGLPGERIRIEANRGVYINGTLLDEPYVEATPNYDVAEQIIPDGQYFVLGDNRRNSSDSHVASNGPVTIANIVGRAWISYWPSSHFGPLPQPTYSPDLIPSNPGPIP